MNARRLLLAPVAVGALALAVGCGGSDKPSAAAASTPSKTKPAHDLRINSELEKYVTDDWNKMLADSTGANYAQGVTVTKVRCIPSTGTSVSNCTIALSSGQSKRFGYIVAGDGTSVERAEPVG
ncbi:MAG: hypothetical protein ACJ71T_10110 [Actinomycetales bacterium]